MKAPRISLSESFLEREPQDQIEWLIELASSNNHALDLMQKERNALLERVAILEAQLMAASSAVEIHKNIAHTSMTESNAKVNALSKDVADLRTIIKDLRA